MFALLLILLWSPSIIAASQLSNIEKRLNITHFTPPTWNSPDVTYMNEFSDITLISYTGQQNFSVETNDSALIYYNDDTYIKLFATTSNAHIQKIVPYLEDSFILSGTGEFNGIDLRRQVLFNLTSMDTLPVLSSEIEDVNSILAINRSVIFAGNFTYKVADSEGHGAIYWDGAQNETKLFPFQGFEGNSSVNSVIQLDNTNILFAGSFQALQNSSLVETIANGSNNSNVDLADLQLDQSVPLKLSSITGGTLHKDLLICPSSGGGNGWSVSDSLHSVLQFDLANEIHPSKVRVYNSLEESSEISMFRIITSPANGIMNLTYIDPNTGDLKQCDAWCPLLPAANLTKLSESSSTASRSKSINNNSTDLKWSSSFQEFAFVNNVPVTMLQFVSLDSYGNSVALHSFEIFETEFSVFSNNTYNIPNCDAVSQYSQTELSDSGWYANPGSESYVMAPVTGGNPYAEFHPNITYPGKYTLNIYTPGCLQDDSCSNRGIVNVTMIDTATNEVLSTKRIYQTNNEDKFDPLYSGMLSSSPQITITWDNSFGQPDPIMVVGKLGIITEFIDTESISNNASFRLNGLFQYNTENITASLDLSNGTINRYAVDSVPPSSELFAALIGHELLVAGNFSGIAKIELDDDLFVSSSQRMRTTGYTTGIFTYSQGILLVGSYTDDDDSMHEILSYNGNAFNNFGQLDLLIDNIVNVTVNGSELLLFDDAYIFNVSAATYVSNSSTFAIGGSAAATNLYDDSLLFGTILKRSFGDINGIVNLSSNGQLSESQLSELPPSSHPMRASYLNETSTLFALREDLANGTQYRVMISNTNSSSHLLQLQWSSPINTLLYDKEQNIIAVGTNGTSSSNRFDTQFTVLNLTGYESVGRSQFDSSSSVNTMVFFNSNNSVLVGGSYEIDNCRDLCLYNYEDNKWNQFLNGSISGDVRQLQFSDSGDTLLIGGLLQTVNHSNVQLISMNVSSNSLAILKTGEEPLLSFSTLDNSTDNIVANTAKELLQFKAGDWSMLDPPLQNDSIVSGFTVISNEASRKRDEGSHIFVLEGILNSPEYGDVDSFVFDQSKDQWQPYFATSRSSQKDKGYGQGSFFQNIDNLYLSSSQKVLQANDSNIPPVSSPTTSPSSSQESPSKNSKIDRGFVVLIGLALALATVAVIGLIGTVFSFIFMRKRGYESLKPRINQNDMLDTVPPEKLMKFI